MRANSALRREKRAAWWLLAPVVIAFGVFQAVPILLATV
jgi:ABC-type sugar transport system permease subunit